MVLKNSLRMSAKPSELNIRMTESRHSLEKLIEYLQSNREMFEGIVDINGILDSPRGFYLAEESDRLVKAYQQTMKRLQD